MKKIYFAGRAAKFNLTPPPDKSVSQRALIIAAISRGKSEIFNVSECEDCAATGRCLKKLGIKIRTEKEKTVVCGKKFFNRRESSVSLNAENSAATMRLLSGVLAGQNFKCSISGGESLAKRPMGRVAEPLSMMGAEIGLYKKNYPPVKISPGKLSGIKYKLPVASAQVKSAVLLAGVYASGKTEIIKKCSSRDHTERMLRFFGAKIQSGGGKAVIKPSNLFGKKIRIPGDFSSAAPFIAAACLVKNSRAFIKNVGLNPTRTGFIEILKKMGGEISLRLKKKGFEPEGNLKAVYSPLKAVKVDKKIIPSMIDEIPLLALTATQAEGTTFINGADELKYKESDRIKETVKLIRKLGGKIKYQNKTLIIKGKRKLKGGILVKTNDHRMIMAAAVAGLICEKPVTISNPERVKKSYPGFFRDFDKAFCPRQT